MPDINRKRPAEGDFFIGNIARKEETYAIAGRAPAVLGDIDILIHNASTLGPTPVKYLLDTRCEDFEEVFQTNLLGPFRLTKALAPGMIAQGRGLIVNLSSDAAINGYPARV